MKKPDNGGGRIIARKTKNIVMHAVDHSQARIERGHIFEKTLARRNAVHLGLQLCHIATGLRVAPLFACIADNVAQISFRRQGEGITGGQARPTLPSSSSTIVSTLLVDTPPAKPSAIRCPSKVFSSRHATSSPASVGNSRSRAYCLKIGRPHV